MKKFILAVAVFAVLGCEEGNLTVADDRAGFDPRLVLSAQSTDYSTSDVILIGDSNSKDDAVAQGDIESTNPNDIAIAAHGSDVYRIGRYGSDNITKMHWDNDSEQLEVDWQYSVLSKNDGFGNPQDFVVYDSSTAYVSLYDSKYLLRVNPNATSSSDFVLDEIDLSKFINTDSFEKKEWSSATNSFVGTGVFDTASVPHMTDMVVFGDKLFVLLERLGLNYEVSTDSWVVVLDAATGKIIEPDNSGNIFDPASDTLTDNFYINLNLSNANNFSVDGSKIFVAARGDYFNEGALNYNGGIVSFIPNDSGVDIEPTLVIDDDYNDGMVDLDGHIYSVDVNANGDIYFSTYVTSEVKDK